MIANAVVRARIDEKTKAEATVVLASIGIPLSDAIRLIASVVRLPHEFHNKDQRH
jgi:DNA-damage-inducible protein J